MQNQKRLSKIAFGCCGMSGSILVAALLSTAISLWTYVPPIGVVMDLPASNAVDIYNGVKGAPRESMVCEELARRADRSGEYASWLVSTSRSITNQATLLILGYGVLGIAGFGYLGLQLRPRSTSQSGKTQP